jgi:hypothetical protein
MWVTCPHSASSGYHAEFHETCYQKHTNLLNCRTSSLAISGYQANFHEGYGTVREWQRRGMACVKACRGRGTAWARHSVCELAIRDWRCWCSSHVTEFLIIYGVISVEILRKFYVTSCTRVYPETPGLRRLRNTRLWINACENCPRPPSYVQLGTLTQ